DRAVEYDVPLTERIEHGLPQTTEQGAFQVESQPYVLVPPSHRQPIKISEAGVAPEQLGDSLPERLIIRLPVERSGKRVLETLGILDQVIDHPLIEIQHLALGLLWELAGLVNFQPHGRESCLAREFDIEQRVGPSVHPARTPCRSLGAGESRSLRNRTLRNGRGANARRLLRRSYGCRRVLLRRQARFGGDDAEIARELHALIDIVCRGVDDQPFTSLEALHYAVVLDPIRDQNACRRLRLVRDRLD